MTRLNRWIAGGAGAAIVALFLVLSRIDGLNQRTGLFLGLFGAAFALYAAALVLRTRSGGRLPLYYVLAVALLGRAVLIPAVPAVSGV